jgi:hypothetical protein
MKFKCKIITPNGKENIEEMTAQNEQKLRELYQMMGYQLVEIMEKSEAQNFLADLDPETLAKINGANGVPNMGGGASKHVPSIPSPTAPPPPPKYKEYSDNGINYRVELNSGKLQKQDWVKLDSDELKDISIDDNGKMVTAYSKKLKLYRLKWVDLG